MTTPTSQGAVMDPDGMDLLNFSSDEEDNGPSSFSSDEINNGFAVMNQTNLPVTGDTPAVADGIGLPVSATEMENNEPAVFPLPPGFNLMELAIDSIDPTLEPPALDGIDPAALILEPPHQEEAAVNLVPNNLQPLNFSMNFPFGPAGTGFGPINTALQLNQPLLNMPPLADNMPFLRGDMPLLADNMPLLRGDLPPVQPEEGAAMMGAESSGMALFAAPGGEEMPALKNRDDTQQDLESTGGDAVNEQQSFTAFIWELVAMYVIGDAADICEGKSFYKDFVYEILERAQSRTGEPIRDLLNAHQ
ncbi:hypothetical protein F5Y16DRAFT_101684 [Xylariaceae sp. FL0255]|nr:hypothetical protein F5Y16DRAFT_101684 [Xylariaceae sp. FL0255]